MEETTHSSLHRGQHLQFLSEQGSEIHRNQYCEQFSAVWIVWQSSALVSPTKILNTDLFPIDDDTEPIEARREHVEMENDEDEEPMEVEFPRARTNPKNPMSRENQEHEDSGHAVHATWCAALSRVQELVDNIELNCWRREREEMSPTVAFDYGFVTQENAGSLPILIC